MSPGRHSLNMKAHVFNFNNGQANLAFHYRLRFKGACAVTRRFDLQFAGSPMPGFFTLPVHVFERFSGLVFSLEP